MKKGNYEILVNNIADAVGGRENITYFAHCMTRLRFNLKDQSRVDLEKIKELKGVLGAQWSNNQLQIVVGPAVKDVYEMICTQLGMEKEKSVDENIGEDSKKKFGLSAILDAIAGCLTPLISLMIGAGLIKVLVIVGGIMGLLTPESPTNKILTFVADSGFYFLPIFIGATAAKKFGANQGLGMLLGAMLIHPTFISNVSEGVSMSVFGIPVYAASYTSSIFPAIITVYVLSHVERFFTKYSPDFLRTILVPFLSIVVMVPLTLCVIAPAGSFLGTYLAIAVMWIYDVTGFFGVALLSALYPILVITGMHGALVPYMFQSFAAFGFEPIVTIAGILSNINQGAAAAAVAFRSKDKDISSAAASSAFTAIIGGVTEPAMFGINLKLKKPLYAAMIGNFCGAAFAGIMKVRSIAFSGSAGIFAVITKDPMIYMIISLLIGFVVTFIATLIMYKGEIMEQ